MVFNFFVGVVFLFSFVLTGIDNNNGEVVNVVDFKVGRTDDGGIEVGVRGSILVSIDTSDDVGIIVVHEVGGGSDNIIMYKGMLVSL